MNYADHLNYEEFSEPVCFRVESVNDVDSLIPTYGINQDILVDKYDLEEGTEFDVALFVGESKAEFAFDAKNVEKDEVIEDVKTLIHTYNEPPEELDEKEKEEYREMNVEITDISTNN